MEKSFVHHHDKHQGRLATTSEGDYDYAKSDDNELLNIANFWCFSGNPWSCLRVQKIDRGSQQPSIRPLWLPLPSSWQEGGSLCFQRWPDLPSSNFPPPVLTRGPEPRVTCEQLRAEDGDRGGDRDKIMLAYDWLRQITWPEHWPVIGQ